MPEAEFAPDILADNIELARKQLVLGKVVVFSHSGNALIAIEYAKKCPASVSNAVMIGIAPTVGPANSAARDRYWSESASPERKAVMEDSLRRLPDAELAKLPP